MRNVGGRAAGRGQKVDASHVGPLGDAGGARSAPYRMDATGAGARRGAMHACERPNLPTASASSCEVPMLFQDTKTSFLARRDQLVKQMFDDSRGEVYCVLCVYF